MYMPLWLEKRSQLTPDRIAIEMGELSVSFIELRTRARALAAKLHALNIKKGDVVAVLSGNSITVVEIVHALHYVGAIFLPLNPRLSAFELAFQLKDAEAKLLLFSEPLMDELKEEQFSQLNMKTVAISQLHTIAYEMEHDSFEYTFKLGDTQTIMYTSGTTGTPKGVLLSGQNHYTSAIGSALNLGLHDDDCWLLAVPMFHISGLSILMRSVIYGMRVIVLEKFDEAKVNHAIIHDGVTIVSVVSNMLQRMLAELGAKSYPSSFRCMLLGGGPAPKPLLEACVAKGIPVVQTYGMTETAAQIVTLPPAYMLTKLGSAGKPLFQAGLKIVNNGELAKACEPGDIFVFGEQVTKGYLNREEANQASFEKGWLNTGDVGYLDEEGFLYVLDRRKDLFISGGENVYPAEVEAALIAHEWIFDAGVTSVEDETWGAVGIAFIVVSQTLVPPLQEEEIVEHIRMHLLTRLAKYKVPKFIYIVDDLPRNASNKLLRRELLQLLPIQPNAEDRHDKN